MEGRDEPGVDLGWLLISLASEPKLRHKGLVKVNGKSMSWPTTSEAALSISLALQHLENRVVIANVIILCPEALLCSLSLVLCQV